VAYVVDDLLAADAMADVLAHLHALNRRGHEVSLYTVGRMPSATGLPFPVHVVQGYGALVNALTAPSAITVATSPRTANAVWRATVVTGVPVYLVQEQSLPHERLTRRPARAVAATYRPEFRYIADSAMAQERLEALGLEATIVEPEAFDDLEDCLQSVARPGWTIAAGTPRPALRRTAR
jgi:hypothetical protein